MNVPLQCHMKNFLKIGNFFFFFKLNKTTNISNCSYFEELKAPKYKNYPAKSIMEILRYYENYVGADNAYDSWVIGSTTCKFMRNFIKTFDPNFKNF